MWTFVRVEGVEPTNNVAERTIRHAVLYRKGCFGTRSEEGSRLLERILTVVATLRQQKRNVMDYLTDASMRAMVGLQLSQQNGADKRPLDIKWNRRNIVMFPPSPKKVE